MPWCFGIVNGRLTEIYFQKNSSRIRITGHCYIDRKDYKTKQERKWIEEDTLKYRFIYRMGKYRAADSTSALNTKLL